MYLSREYDMKLREFKNKLNYRTKQIDIYFKYGSPIFNYYQDNKYIIYKNNFDKTKITII